MGSRRPLKEPLNETTTQYTQTDPKGQIKPKADWRAIDSPKKRTNEFALESGNT